MKSRKIRFFFSNGDINLLWNWKDCKRCSNATNRHQTSKCGLISQYFVWWKACSPSNLIKLDFSFYFHFSKKIPFNLMAQPKFVKLIMKVASLMKFDKKFVAFAPLTQLWSRWIDRCWSNFFLNLLVRSMKTNKQLDFLAIFYFFIFQYLLQVKKREWYLLCANF